MFFLNNKDNTFVFLLIVNLFLDCKKYKGVNNYFVFSNVYLLHSFTRCFVIGLSFQILQKDTENI